MPKDSQTRSVLGIIGGSGLYDLPGLEAGGMAARGGRPGASPPTTSSSPSSAGSTSRFLPRHGRGHRLLADRTSTTAPISTR